MYLKRNSFKSDFLESNNLASLEKRISQIKMNLIYLVFALVFISPAYAASFDCNKARTAHEKFICSTPELNEADSQLGLAYIQAMRTFKYSDFLKRDQLAWLRSSYRDCGNLKKCLKVLNDRINDLNSYKSAAIYTDSTGGKDVDMGGGTIFLFKSKDAVRARFIGNYMPDMEAANGKFKGYPHDGSWCDHEFTLVKKGNVFIPEGGDEFSLLIDDKRITMSGSIMCSPRAMFGKGVYLRYN